MTNKLPPNKPKSEPDPGRHALPEMPKKPRDPHQTPIDPARTDLSSPMERVVNLPKVGPK